MTEYVVLYERAENGDWGAYLPDLPGVVAGGGTREEVEELIKGSVEMALEWDQEHGTPPPIPAHEAGIIEIEADSAQTPVPNR